MCYNQPAKVYRQSNRQEPCNWSNNISSTKPTPDLSQSTKPPLRPRPLQRGQLPGAPVLHLPGSVPQLLRRSCPDEGSPSIPSPPAQGQPAGTTDARQELARLLRGDESLSRRPFQVQGATRPAALLGQDRWTLRPDLHCSGTLQASPQAW